MMWNGKITTSSYQQASRLKEDTGAVAGAKSRGEDGPRVDAGRLARSTAGSLTWVRSYEAPRRIRARTRAVNYQINVAHRGEKVLERLDKPSERRIRQRIVLLAEDPFDPRRSPPLTGREGLRKSLVGGWRVLFTADRAAKASYVLTVDTRGQVYKHS